MKLSKSVAELQREHVVLELECIERMYLNAYVPQLTSEAGVAGFVRGHLGYRFASTKQVAEMTDVFVESIMQFGLDDKIDLIRFKKGQRKDDVMQARLRAFKKKYQEGVVFIGVAQLEQRGIDYEALDNGISWGEDLPAAQRICDHFDRAQDRSLFP